LKQTFENQDIKLEKAKKELLLLKEKTGKTPIEPSNDQRIDGLIIENSILRKLLS